MFASGQIPAQPNGNPYPCAVGPDTSCNINPTLDLNANQGYKLSAVLSDNTTHTVTSTAGTLAEEINSCDPTGVLSNGLVGYWKMDEGSGGIVSNSGGSGAAALNGAISGATWTTSGKSSNALNFDTNDRVYLTNPSLLNIGGSLTISAWVKYSRAYTNMVYNSYGTIAGKSSPANWNDSYRIFAGKGSSGTPDTYKYRLGFGRGTHSGNVDLITDENYNDNNWHFITGVQDMNFGRMYLYVDGAQKKAGVNAGTISNNHDFNIGYEPSRGYFNGVIDDVRVYNRALSSAEVALLYNSGNGCF